MKTKLLECCVLGVCLVVWAPARVVASPQAPVAWTRAQAERGSAPRGDRPGVVPTPRGPVAGRATPPRGRAMTAAEVEQMFDRYVLRQARAALRLDQRQMQQVAPRLQRLQTARRRAARQQQVLVRELGDLTRAGVETDEATIAAKLRDLQQQVDRAEQQVQVAVGELDAILTVEQRALLRVFEQRMERRKLELLAEARRLARGQRPPADEAP